MLQILISMANRKNQIYSIANAFREHYANIFTNSANERDKVSEFNKMRLHFTGDVGVDTLLSVEDIESAVRNQKKGKAAGVDNIVAEHVVNSHPCLIVHLSFLPRDAL